MPQGYGTDQEGGCASGVNSVYGAVNVRSKRVWYPTWYNLNMSASVILGRSVTPFRAHFRQKRGDSQEALFVSSDTVGGLLVGG